MENKSIKIELIQNGHIVSFSTEINDQKLSVIAGTIALRIVTMFQNIKKYKVNLNGFSFARKFDVKLIIEGKEVSGTQAILNGTIKFGLTLQNNEKSVAIFGDFIKGLVCDVLTGQSEAEIEIEDLLDEVGLNVN